MKSGMAPRLYGDRAPLSAYSSFSIPYCASQPLLANTSVVLPTLSTPPACMLCRSNRRQAAWSRQGCWLVPQTVRRMDALTFWRKSECVSAPAHMRHSCVRLISCLPLSVNAGTDIERCAVACSYLLVASVANIQSILRKLA